MRRWSQGTTHRSAIETRYLRLADGLIAEEFAGPNTFQIADLELNQWGLVPADTSIDPNPEILTASPTEVSGKRPESIAERFVDAFGRNDPDSLLALYDQRFTLYSPIAWGLPGRDPLRPFVEQFHQGFPGLRLALLDQFSSADGTRVGFRFGMRWHNTGTFFGHPPTGDRGTHAEFHSLRLVDGQIVEQIVTDISYGIPKHELTVWHREYPTDTEDPAPRVGAGGASQHRFATIHVCRACARRCGRRSARHQPSSIAVRLVPARGSTGITEASATTTLPVPATTPSGSTTAAGSPRWPMRHVPTGWS